MTELNFSTPEPIGLRPRGTTASLGSYEYKQGTLNSADLTDDNPFIALVAGKTAVIDRLVVSFGAAISLNVIAKTVHVEDNLVAAIYGAANSTVTIEGPIRSDTVGEAISFQTSGEGNITIFVIYHYE